MAFAAGEIVTAGRLNALQPVSYEAIALTSLNSVNTTETDINGATVTFNTSTANAVFKVDAVFDCNVLATSTTVLMVGKCSVDGSTQSGTAIFAMDTLLRGTVSALWRGTLAAPGAHTIKLRGNLSGALATGGDFVQGDTKIHVTIYEAV